MATATTCRASSSAEAIRAIGDLCQPFELAQRSDGVLADLASNEYELSGNVLVAKVNRARPGDPGRRGRRPKRWSGGRPMSRISRAVQGRWRDVRVPPRRAPVPPDAKPT